MVQTVADARADGDDVDVVRCALAPHAEWAKGGGNTWLHISAVSVSYFSSLVALSARTKNQVQKALIYIKRG